MAPTLTSLKVLYKTKQSKVVVLNDLELRCEFKSLSKIRKGGILKDLYLRCGLDDPFALFFC